MIVNEELISESAAGVKTIAWNELQTSTGHADRLPSLPAITELAVTGDDPMVIFFSSGTTGPQKAVVLSHRNINAQFIISWSVTLLLLILSLFAPCGLPGL